MQTFSFVFVEKHGCNDHVSENQHYNQSLETKITMYNNYCWWTKTKGANEQSLFSGCKNVKVSVVPIGDNL